MITPNSIKTLRPLKIDAYILKQVAAAMATALFFVLFFLLMFQALRISDFLIVNQVSPNLLAKMTSFLIVSFLPTSLLISFFVAILYTFNRLSADSEIIALKASAVPLYRLLAPLFAFAFVISMLSFQLNSSWVPWSLSAFKTAEDRVANTKAVSIIKEGTFTTGYFDLLVFADQVDHAKNKLHKVFIYDEREKTSPLTYIAREAEILPVKTHSKLGRAVLFRLYDGSLHHTNLKQNTYEKIDFESYHLYLKINEGIRQEITSRPNMIPQNQLISLMEKERSSSSPHCEFLSEYWRRYALSLSPFIFVLLGVGLGTFQIRTSKSHGLIFGVFSLLSYWTLQLWGTSLSLQGSIPPAIAMQLANLSILSLSVYLFRKASW